MDTKSLLQLIDLRTLAEEAGAQFTSSNSSRCPLHRGDNRSAFHLYQGQDGIWRWHCFTNCQEGSNGGDAITFYMLWRQVDFKTALLDLSKRAGVQFDAQTTKPNVVATPPSKIDPPPEPPGAEWIERAEAFIKYSAIQLWSDCGSSALEYLRSERGLMDETIKRFRLGYNPHDIWDNPARWGDTRRKLIYCARGIVIPHQRQDGATWFVNIRRPLPGDGLASRVGAVNEMQQMKFCGPRGGVRGLFAAFPHGFPIALLVEGEFDTILAWQAANDLCDVFTLGGARHRLDAFDVAYLTKAIIIAVILDSDRAGQRGCDYLRSALSKRALVVEPPDHDLTDFWRKGGNLRKWLGGLVACHMEPLLRGLNEHTHAELFTKWMDTYLRAVDAEAGK